LVYKVFGINEMYARLVSVVFSSLGAVALYLLTLKLFGQKIALVTSLFYALNPYNIYYGRVIMPDPIFISLSLISAYLFLLKPWGIASAVIFALSLLTKPYAIFLLPLLFYWGKWKPRAMALWGVIACIPFILWRIHFNNHPEGSFASTWLLNGSNIRFSGAFFRWLIYERMNRLIFATGGFVLFVLGIIASYQDKKRLGIFIWLLSIAAYMTIFAMGNVTHDYYQLPLVPVGSILVAFGFWQIVNSSKKIWVKLLNYGLALSLLVLSLAFGWYEVRGYFNINHPEIVAAGKAVDRLTPKDALVVAAYNSDPAFLYQTNRHGWPDGVNLEDKVRDGATHYVSINFDNVSQYLEGRCPTLDKTDQYIILELTSCL
ncbi:glycosyltransferase family 39 protein, partial [Patescibacteria group bacterium]|nr:glycosyltransferase family 39 protein [Patescibacteria group bacterium]